MRERRHSSRVSHSEPLTPTISVSPRIMASSVNSTSAMANRPTAAMMKPTPSCSSTIPPVKRDVPLCRSMPTVAIMRPRNTAKQAFGTRVPRQRGHRRHREHQQGKVFGRPDLQGEACQRNRQQAEQDDADRAGDERTDRGDGECCPGTTVLGHLEAVERRHDRRGFARRVDEDGGGGAAVLRAVVEPGQHDQRRRRLHAEGRRQQQRHSCRRAEPGQHAHDRAHAGSRETRRRGSRARAPLQSRRGTRRSAPSPPTRSAGCRPAAGHRAV